MPLDRESRIPDGAALHDLISGGTVSTSRHHLTVKLPPKGYGYYAWKA
ncbi:MAG: hypothetical protein ACYCW6_10855 [Candidatus Xenobia bacterium]